MPRVHHASVSFDSHCFLSTIEHSDAHTRWVVPRPVEQAIDRLVVFPERTDQRRATSCSPEHKRSSAPIRARPAPVRSTSRSARTGSTRAHPRSRKTVDVTIRSVVSPSWIERPASRATSPHRSSRRSLATASLPKSTRFFSAYEFGSGVDVVISSSWRDSRVHLTAHSNCRVSRRPASSIAQASERRGSRQ